MISTELAAMFAATLSALAAVCSALVPAVLDKRKADRERAVAERERIRDAAGKLLRQFANFRHKGKEDQCKAAGLPYHQQVTAELRGAFEAWALVVLPRLDPSGKNRVKEIRERELGRVNLMKTEAENIGLSPEIFDLTWTASENVKPPFN